MKKLIPVLLCVLSLQAKEIQIPNLCEGPVCIANLVWKKGVNDHTLSGKIISQKPIQSIQLMLDFEDGQRSGGTHLNLRSIAATRSFFFKVNAGGVLVRGSGLKWESSSIRLAVTAIHEIAAMEQDGLICNFSSYGSRLDVSLKNQTKRDLIFDYSMLMLTSGEMNLKMNGASGKYSEMDKPKPNSLIPAGTTHSEQLIPPKAVEFANGEWKEYWLVHLALTKPEPKLIIPFLVDGKTQIEKIPLQVTLTKLETSAKVEGQR